MLHKNPRLSAQHISDEDLVRSADGELSSKRAAEVEAHLEACWDCRARMEAIHSTITGFVRAHHAQFDGRLPQFTGPRALLRARLAELGTELRVQWWKRVPLFAFALPREVVIGFPLLAIAIGIFWFPRTSQRPPSVPFDQAAVPNRSLTPGATRPVTMNEVCSVPQEEVIGEVSISLRQEVLQEYGISNARPEDYEIDYLIAPGLGGTEDLHNLWPEPYRDRLWNAHVKDALEERLHEMVCGGELDLHTAQREIATDWIAAYKKYFHTDKPLPVSS
jgi:Putative zinc-finger